MLGDYDVVGRYVIYQGMPKVEMVNGHRIYFTNDWSLANSFEDFQKKTEAEHISTTHTGCDEMNI